MTLHYIEWMIIFIWSSFYHGESKNIWINYHEISIEWTYSCWGTGDGGCWGGLPDVFIFWAQTGQIPIKMAMKMKRKWQNLIIDRWFSGCFPMISQANPYPLDPIRLFFDAPYGPWPVHTIHSWNFLNPNHLQGRSTTWIVLIPSPVHISYTPILWSQWNVVIPCTSRSIHHGFVVRGYKNLRLMGLKKHPIEKKNDPIVRSHGLTSHRQIPTSKSGILCHLLSQLNYHLVNSSPWKDPPCY